MRRQIYTQVWILGMPRTLKTPWAPAWGRWFVGQGTAARLASSKGMAHQEPLTKKELFAVGELLSVWELNPDTMKEEGNTALIIKYTHFYCGWYGVTPSRVGRDSSSDKAAFGSCQDQNNYLCQNLLEETVVKVLNYLLCDGP